MLDVLSDELSIVLPLYTVYPSPPSISSFTYLLLCIDIATIIVILYYCNDKRGFLNAIDPLYRTNCLTRRWFKRSMLESR